MGKVIELYKGDSVTRVLEGSKAEAAFLADGFTRQKPSAEVSESADKEEPVSATRSRRRQRQDGR